MESTITITAEQIARLMDRGAMLADMAMYPEGLVAPDHEWTFEELAEHVRLITSDEAMQELRVHQNEYRIGRSEDNQELPTYAVA